MSTNAISIFDADSLIEAIDWQKVNGLIPAIIQAFDTAEVLMLGVMSKEAIRLTCQTGQVTFYSRRKKRLWLKGETSGHFLTVTSLALDCDHDSLLIQAAPKGPTCHLGTSSCWGDRYRNNELPFEDKRGSELMWLASLERLIQSRKHQSAEHSYTGSLFAKGTKRMAQKVGEEGVEVALAAMSQDKTELINESADLLYHLTVLLADQGLSLTEVVDCLQQRHLSAKD